MKFHSRKDKPAEAKPKAATGLANVLLGASALAPVEARKITVEVWRVVEADGSMAGKDKAPADGGGFVPGPLQVREDAARAANHLAATINERRRNAGKLA